MIDEIKHLFDQKSENNKLIFHPEIKVKRERDILYISSLASTKGTLRATVEVGVSGDKASMPIGILDELSLKAIRIRLQGMRFPNIEKIK